MALTITSAATKAAIASAAANRKLVVATTPSQPRNANQTSAGDSTTNPPRGFEGPATGIAGLTRPSADSLGPKSAADKQASVDKALGLVSQSTAVKTLAGIGTGTTAGSSTKDTLTDLTGSSQTDKPGGDQGFSGQPSNLAANPMTGLNPMAAFQGQSVGGVLGAAATNDQPAPSSGAVGSGLVGAWYHWDWAIDQAVKLREWLNNQQTTSTGSKSNKGPENPNGSPDNIKLTTPENTGSNVNILTRTLLDQLNAAKAGKPSSQGGSGDVTPVDNGGMAVVGNNGSIAANQASTHQRNMVGQPGGGAIGDNIGGGNRGLNGFGSSRGAGVTNPGAEAGSPAGDRRFQQHEAAALGGNQPAPPLPSPNSSANSTQSNPSELRSNVSATLSAGVRNLTLTGTAAINGTGNGLDNLINGNAATNELRGEAGQDSLDGKAGNDLLDGGAGRDQLTGGSGADRFRFCTAGAFGAAQADRITDFSRSEGDRIELSGAAFGLAAGTTLTVQAVSSDADLSRALGSGTLLVQDLRDGSLLFNQNGTAAGAGQGGVFAVVSHGLTLKAGDFALSA